MTVKKRLARSNIVMLLVPVLVLVVLGLGGAAVFLYILDTAYLPRVGMSLEDIHNSVEQYETMFQSFEVSVWIYVGVFIFAVVFSIVLTNLYLTRFVFSHISGPLDILMAGVERIRCGDLESPIGYTQPDEFRPACDAVDLMAQRLKESMDRSQREQQSRKELFAGMSHDLRSPLTSIRAYTEALMDGVAKTPEAQRKYLETISSKENEMETMVTRLFEFSKMELDEYPVHLETLDAKEKIESAGAHSVSENFVLTTDSLSNEMITADAAQLDRIVMNLIDNSRKYANRDRVHMDISSRRAGERVYITFADDGVGVPEEMLPKLFEVFYRADPARKNPSGGSGLGLAIVKKAAEQMGGEVHAEKSRLGGLAVILELPAAEGEKP